MCSIAPRMRRPRGPRKLRPPEETKPSVARRPRPPGLASATTGAPMHGVVAGLPAHRRARRPVSTATTARSRSESTPATVAGLAAAVGEEDGDLLAAQVVRAREHAARRRSRRPSRGPSRDRGRRPTDRPSRRRSRWCPEGFSTAFMRAPEAVTCELQVTIHRVRSGRDGAHLAPRRRARQRGRPLDAPARGGAPRRAAPLRRPPGAAAADRPQRAHAAPAPAGGRGPRARAALQRAPAALRVRADRLGPRARRRAAPARRLGRPPPRVRRAAAPRRLRHAGGGALVVPDVRAAGRTRTTQAACTSPDSRFARSD